SLLQFSGTLLNLNAALNGLIYSPPASPGTGNLQVILSDLGNTGLGGAQSASASVPLDVNPAGNPPTIFTKNTTLNFTELSPAKVIDSGITLVDSSTSTITSATVTISGGFAEDVLAFTSNGG